MGMPLRQLLPRTKSSFKTPLQLSRHSRLFQSTPALTPFPPLILSYTHAAAPIARQAAGEVRMARCSVHGRFADPEGGPTMDDSLPFQDDGQLHKESGRKCSQRPEPLRRYRCSASWMAGCERTFRHLIYAPLTASPIQRSVSRSDTSYSQ